MKVIIIKKYDKYNVDDVIEVADGFGTNFLIKKGYALPVNKVTTRNLEIKKDNEQLEFEKNKQKAITLKGEIEKLELTFYLKVTNDVIHGSITSKKVLQALNDKGYKIDKYAMPHIQIASLGISKVKIKLFSDVEATLHINVKGEHGK